MTLTKAAVKARLVQIAEDPQTPENVRAWLSDMLDRSPKYGRTGAEIQGKVEAILTKPVQKLTLDDIGSVLDLLNRFWDTLP